MILTNTNLKKEKKVSINIDTIARWDYGELYVTAILIGYYSSTLSSYKLL